jgi:hypothetical protein
VSPPGPEPDATNASCEGTLVVSAEGGGVCDAGSGCRVLALADDDDAYRAAHERVVTQAQSDNKAEYGGEA